MHFSINLRDFSHKPVMIFVFRPRQMQVIDSAFVMQPCRTLPIPSLDELHEVLFSVVFRPWDSMPDRNIKRKKQTHDGLIDQ
jgi:hypothetical protein